MQHCTPVVTPIDSSHQLMATEIAEQHTDATAYQQIIRSLMYLVTGTRPDLGFTITHLLQFNASASIKHLMAAKQVLRYLQGTKDRHFFYAWNNQLKITAYMDESDGNCYIQGEAIQVMYFNFGMWLFMGDVGNSGRLLPLHVKLNIWQLFWGQHIISDCSVELKRYSQ